MSIETETEGAPRPLEQIVALIADALRELGHASCPYCQMYIRLDKFITEEDIRRWLIREVKSCE